MAVKLSSTAHTLLHVLSDQAWHSGQELADQLSMSRTSVWKQLSRLQELGVAIDVQKKQGYRLQAEHNWLDADAIYQALSDEARDFFQTPDVFFDIDSTNMQARRELAPGYVCLTERQTQGRGRRGRAWHTPLASQIAMSVVHEFQLGASSLAGLSLAVGLAVAQAVESVCNQHANTSEQLSLKWPNDIWFGQAKLAGILLEMVGDIEGPCQVVIGIGMNVDVGSTLDVDNEYTDLKRIYTDLPTRNQIVSAMLESLYALLSDYEQTGFAYYKNAWTERDLLNNQRVSILSQNETLNGIEKGVNEHGHLLIEDEQQQLHSITVGDVSLRAQS